ncbi:periplasmic binding protein/LacI transcriptional regulator [Parafrankia sp. EAN1pec]|nr:periplasmic binding protein/LacI transcriptional regulator [Frankia sp. EAN1pec]
MSDQEGMRWTASGRVSGSPRRRAIAALVLVLAAALVLFRCGGSSVQVTDGRQGSGGNPTVGLITKSYTNPFFVKMRDGAQQAAREQKVELLTATGRFDGDYASQVSAIENMVAAGARGILITPNDSKAIVPAIEQARHRGVLVIALDVPTDPESAVDALFSTDNFKAGILIGEYARAAMGDTPARIATMDVSSHITGGGLLRHNGFLVGFGALDVTVSETQQATPPSVVCSRDSKGDQAKGRTAMADCLRTDPDINLVYAVNEPAAFGARTALDAAGKADVMIVSIDGGCTGVRAVRDGKIAATSQQYPLKMAEQGVAAVVDYVKDGTKVSGYVDTGTTLIADDRQPGIPSEGVEYGLANCWG